MKFQHSLFRLPVIPGGYKSSATTSKPRQLEPPFTAAMPSHHHRSNPLPDRHQKSSEPEKAAHEKRNSIAELLERKRVTTNRLSFENTFNGVAVRSRTPSSST